MIISECPIRLTEKLFTEEYADIASSFNSITGTNTYNELIERKWYHKENNTSGFYDRDEFYRKNEKYKTNRCIPRYQLVRVKRAETFSTVYLLQVILSILLRYPLRFSTHVVWND